MKPDTQTSHSADPAGRRTFSAPGSPGVNTARLRAEIQHQEAKLRVFKLFLLLLGLSLVVFLISSAVVYRNELRRKSERLASAKQDIAELQSSLSDASLSPYRRAGILVRIVNL